MADDGVRDADGNLSIRTWQVEDDAAVRALDARVQPYTEADGPEVRAMYRRADAARRDGRRWVPLTKGEGGEHTFARHVAAWVVSAPDDRVVGAIGLRRVGDPATCAADTVERALPGDLTELAAGRVAEVRHLRVDPDVRRMRVGTALLRTALQWARAEGFTQIVLNTTAPQSAARGLYEKEGFREFARTFLGCYELVWMRCRLDD